MLGLDRCGRRMILSVACWCCLGVLATPAAERGSSYRAALESIRSAELKGHVEHLAGDAMEGREAGTRGGRAAGDHLAELLRDLGLRGAGVDGGYFQPFQPNFRNVLGLLPGSDPNLKQQVVIVAAHYDHIGYGTRRNSRGLVGKIHNGADDNASGTSGVLETAQAFTLLVEPPRRSILFALWDAEEKGLLGSKHWLADPTLPSEQIVALVNTDMIGRLRDDRLVVFGSRTGYGLRRLVSRNNEGTGLTLDFSWEMKSNADHFPFYQRGIPAMMLHTGLHDDYHRPSDDARRINVPGLGRVTRLLFGIVYDLADGDEPPKFREAARRETEQTRRGLRAPKAPLPDRLDGKPLRVGITWRTDEAEPGTIILTRVVPGSPAAAGGLEPGDRIYRVAGRRFADEAEFAKRATTLPGPLELLVEREGRLRSVQIRFQPQTLDRAA